MHNTCVEKAGCYFILLCLFSGKGLPKPPPKYARSTRKLVPLLPRSKRLKHSTSHHDDGEDGPSQHKQTPYSHSWTIGKGILSVPRIAMMYFTAENLEPSCSEDRSSGRQRSPASSDEIPLTKALQRLRSFSYAGSKYDNYFLWYWN